MSVTTEMPATATAIRPFTIDIPDADLEDMRARIAATRWPEKEGVEDASQGVQLATIQAVARYWLNEYDWRKCEARLNAVLMKRLGYERFVAAGGDYGALVVDYMAGGRDAPASPEPAPPELLGIHTNFPGVFPLDVDKAIKTGSEQSPDLSADERQAAEKLGAAYKHAAYAVQMGTRPQTMYGLNDSPVFLAAYMLDHDPTSYATLIRPAFVDRAEGGLTRADILDNITMFWLTNTGVSTAKSYWEYLGYGSFADVRNVTVPVAVSVFPDELFRAPRSWAEKAYPN